MDVQDEVFDGKKESIKDNVNEKVKDKKNDESPLIENIAPVAPSSDRTALKRTVSAPPNVTEVKLCTARNVVVLLVHALSTNRKPVYICFLTCIQWLGISNIVRLTCNNSSFLSPFYTIVLCVSEWNCQEHEGVYKCLELQCSVLCL